MSDYLVGDIHGCNFELQALLKKTKFDIENDTLWVTGDLASRGPQAIEVLEFLYSIKNKVRMVLGNHDIHLLATYYGIKNKKNKNFKEILKQKNIDKIIHWIQNQPLMQIDYDKKLIMTHAGITPQWDFNTAKECAKEIQNELSSNNCNIFLKKVYKNKEVTDWNQCLKKEDRFSFGLNVFTKMRYCFLNGNLKIKFKFSSKTNYSSIIPWFAFKSHKILSYYTIAFGHWASLKYHNIPKNVIPLDTGCCWGGELTMLKWENQKYFKQNSRIFKKIKN